MCIHTVLHLLYIPSQSDEYVDDQQTETDDEWRHDTPVPIVDIPEIYSEGIHSMGDQPFESNKTKRAKIVPTELQF